MRKSIRQIVALLLVLAMTCAFAAALDEDLYGFGGGDEGKRGRWSAMEEGEIFVIFERYQINLDQGSRTSIMGTVLGAERDATYHWKSTDPDVVEVQGNGAVGSLRAVGPGKAKVQLSVINPDGSIDFDIAYITVKGTVTPVKVEGGGSIRMNAGDSQNVTASVSGGSGSYSYSWESYGAVSITDRMRNNATIYGGLPGNGTVTLTVYDAEDYANNASVSWNVSVAATVTAPTGRLDKTSITLAPGETTNLTLNASGGSGNYGYYWESDYTGVVTVSGSGKTVAVTAAPVLIAGGNTAQIRAAVVDTDTGLRSDVLVCTVTVRGGSAKYDISAATAVGSSLNMGSIAGKIADAFRSQLGQTLNYSASVRLDNPNNRIGVLRLQDDTAVSSYSSYTYAGLQDMSFYPSAPGVFSTGYTITDGGMTISGTITINVQGGIGVENAKLDNTQLKMEPYSSQFLNLSVTPRNAGYTVVWSSSNQRVVQINGSGSSVMVQSGGILGTADVTATVSDVNGNTYLCTCKVTVSEQADTYNPTVTVAMGSDYKGTSVSDSLASRFKAVFGTPLGDNASIRFTALGSPIYGTLRLYNGNAVRANQDYSFRDMVYMYFEPNAAGTCAMSYVLSYMGFTMKGTITVYVRAASLAVTVDPATVVLSPYSEQTIALKITPANAYYQVKWVSDNANVVAVRDYGNSAVVTSKNLTGVVTVTAVVTDVNGVEIRRDCQVQVTNKANTYDPSVSTTLGVPYTGTGTSSAMRSQFLDLYGIRLDDKAATITFASTGNNSIGVLRLQDGTSARANTAYTFEQYVKMYTQPVSTGVFSFPYTLTYSGRTLTGTVSVVITASEINVNLQMESDAPYVFSDPLGRSNGGAVLVDAIRNAVGSSWKFVRFTKFSDGTGTLYLNKDGTALKSTTDVDVFGLSNLYFKPGTMTGTFTAAFTVYNADGGILGSGKLNIAKNSVSFSDVPSNAYYASAVSWAVGKGITSGTGGSKFSPDMQVSRSQVVTFLWRAAGQPKPSMKDNPFKDVKESDYFYEAVLWAVQQGITQGTSATTFDPLATLKRDQLLTFLCRANGGYASGSNWSELAVKWATERGLLEGVPGKFVADSACPRCDVVYYMWKNSVG